MRLSEWVLAIYFTYVTALAQILTISPQIRLRAWIVNLSLLCFYTVLLRWRDSVAVEHLRNWIPLALMLLAYKEMGWLAGVHPDHHLEDSWIVWDRMLLRQWQVRDAIEYSGPLLPSILELSYLLVYALPAFCMVMLYVHRKSSGAETLLVIYLLGLFLSYVQFPFWPSDPPRIVFPGEDAPSVDTLLRRFNQWILGGYGIHTSVFPSAHVSGAIAAAIAMKRVLAERVWLCRGIAIYAGLVTAATVYGRYHYAADAAAGIVIGIAAATLGKALLNRRPTL